MIEDKNVCARLPREDKACPPPALVSLQNGQSGWESVFCLSCSSCSNFRHDEMKGHLGIALSAASLEIRSESTSSQLSVPTVKRHLAYDRAELYREMRRV